MNNINIQGMGNLQIKNRKLDKTDFICTACFNSILHKSKNAQILQPLKLQSAYWLQTPICILITNSHLPKKILALHILVHTNLQISVQPNTKYRKTLRPLQCWNPRYLFKLILHFFHTPIPICKSVASLFTNLTPKKYFASLRQIKHRLTRIVEPENHFYGTTKISYKTSTKAILSPFAAVLI